MRVGLLLLYERGRISLTAHFAGGCLMKCGAVLPAVPGCLLLAVIVCLAICRRYSLAVFFSCRFYLYLLTFLALHGRYLPAVPGGVPLKHLNAARTTYALPLAFSHGAGF